MSCKLLRLSGKGTVYIEQVEIEFIPWNVMMNSLCFLEKLLGKGGVGRRIENDSEDE
jgi:hypothetical protein